MISFYKIQATGNDFIVLDESEINRSTLNEKTIRFLCERHFGVGADGLIFLEHDSSNRLRMHYFNADGSVGEMCGNGLRAAARYAFEKQLFEPTKDFAIVAQDGLHRVWFHRDQTISVEIFAKEETAHEPDLSKITLPSFLAPVGYVNSGVPHLVLRVNKRIDAIPLPRFAPALAHHPIFKNGANVNIIRQVSENRIQVRTFERGVEAETLSCGTGVTAVSLLLWEQNPRLPEQLWLETKGGILKVSKQKGRIILSGPATVVFVGKIQIGPPGKF